MMNSRPLTHLPLNPDDDNPITPNTLLYGHSNTSLQFAQTTDKDLNWLNMWKATQRLTDIFWKKWSKQYLQHILFSRKWSKDNRNVDEGDVVLIVDPDGPRNIWPKGVVLKTYPSRDGRVRIVDVKTSAGIYRRPVAKLVKLDID